MHALERGHAQIRELNIDRHLVRDRQRTVEVATPGQLHPGFERIAVGCASSVSAVDGLLCFRVASEFVQKHGFLRQGIDAHSGSCAVLESDRLFLGPAATQYGVDQHTAVYRQRLRSEQIPRPDRLRRPQAQDEKPGWAMRGSWACGARLTQLLAAAGAFKRAR